MELIRVSSLWGSTKLDSMCLLRVFIIFYGTQVQKKWHFKKKNTKKQNDSSENQTLGEDGDPLWLRNLEQERTAGKSSPMCVERRRKKEFHRWITTTPPSHTHACHNNTIKKKLKDDLIDSNRKNKKTTVTAVFLCKNTTVMKPLWRSSFLHLVLSRR